MLSVRLLLAGTVISLSTLATGQVGSSTPVGATPERVSAIQDCKGRWFEASAIIDPKTKRGTRVRLCSKAGATDAEWIATLKAAADEVKKRDMPADPKVILLAQIDDAIAKAGVASVSTTPKSTPALGSRPKAEVAVAPSIERSAPPPVAVVPSPAPVAIASAPLAAAARAPSVDLKCAERGQPGDAACGMIGRESIIVIKARSGLEQGGRLRLLRRGEDRGEIKLAAMRPGQVVRASLPEKLCAGVNSSKVEFQLAGPTGASGQRFGPFSLRC